LGGVGGVGGWGEQREKVRDGVYSINKSRKPKPRLLCVCGWPMDNGKGKKKRKRKNKRRNDNPLSYRRRNVSFLHFALKMGATVF
jgi:hypothetical protein